MKNLFKIFFLLLVVIFAGCQNDALFEENDSTKVVELDDVSIIKRLGLDVSTIVDKGDYYLVEGDIAFYKKDIKEYANIQEESRLKQGIVNGRLVSLSNVKNITVRIDASVPTSGNGSTWRNAVMTAIDAWNNVSGSCVRFNYTTASTADITVRRTYDSGGALAWTFLPSNQRPPSAVYVNSMHDSYAYQANTLIHEFGHTLGLLHAHSTPGSQGGVVIPGTPAVDNNSIMSYNRDRTLLPGFSQYDYVSIRYLYPAPKFDVTVSGFPNPFWVPEDLNRNINLTFSSNMPVKSYYYTGCMVKSGQGTSSPTVQLGSPVTHNVVATITNVYGETIRITIEIDFKFSNPPAKYHNVKITTTRIN